MVQIVLIRPGSTDFDEQGRIQGTLDIPLNNQGSTKAQQVAEELRQFDISVVYTAPCEAAWQTGSIVAEALGVKVKRLEPLQNVNHGLWQGMEIDEIRRKHPKVFRQWQDQPENICPPEGEMLCEARNRVKSALAKLVKKQKAGTIGLVLPEPLASLVHSLLTQSELGDMWKLGESCGRWQVISLENSGISHRGTPVKMEKARPTPRSCRLD